MSLPLILGLLMILVVLVVISRGQMSVRSRNSEELEARLRPLNPAGPAGQATGKAERERSANGALEFEASIRGLDLPDGAVLDFAVAETVIGSARVERGRVRLEYDSRLGDNVPRIALGQLLEVRHEGAVLMIGHFTED